MPYKKEICYLMEYFSVSGIEYYEYFAHGEEDGGPGVYYIYIIYNTIR